MGKEWSELSPEEKREQRFNRWLSPEGVNFNSTEAEASHKDRVTRLIDAITLKEPDRVPVIANSGHVPARYSGYTIKEVMYDSEKVVKAWRKYVKDFEHDVLPSAGAVRCGRALDILKKALSKSFILVLIIAILFGLCFVVSTPCNNETNLLSFNLL